MSPNDVKILIADESRESRRICAGFLEEKGYVCTQAATGPEALDQARSAAPDVILLSPGLPQMDGAEVCRRLKADPTLRHLPVIMLTTRRRADGSMEPFEPQADECLAKPFPLAELFTRVRTAAAIKQTQDALSAARRELLLQAERTSAKPVVAEAEAPYGLENLSGREVAGYQLERPLGRGNTGVVYLARHKVLGHLGVMKLLPLSRAQWEPAELERFIRGAQAAAGIDHPNVVPVLDAGREDEFYYVVSKYIAGEPLIEPLLRQGRLSVHEVTAIGIDVADALHAAHECHVLHRDVKPSNIILDKQGRARLTDFGLARELGKSRITSSSVIVGTPDYMSPEQCEGADLDVRSDIYSLGATLYHLLTGLPPAQADSPIAVLRKQVEVVPPPASEVRPEVPAGISDIVARMLAKNKGERYATAAEAAATLRAQARAFPAS